MKKIFMLLVLMFAMIANTKIVLAETLTPDQIDIKTLIKNMYAIDPDTFEYGEFGGKYKKGWVVVEGKIDTKRHCQLLAEFLVKEAVVKEDKTQSCKTGNGGYFRYPNVYEMDLSSATRSALLPKAQIKLPMVNGEKAKVQVLLPMVDANVMYYLRRQPEGWRIYRVESSKNSATIETMDERQGDKIDIFPPEK